ncbi:TOBE domain-containing protein [Micrococcoides hystricis]|uniref:Molybdopterin-binding protein n=1 Tax=Micrococcoides hystricis TaxID=1572761 RepID=A0ABV6PD28_9MICC
MRLSTRNQLKGVVESVDLSEAMAVVRVKVGENVFTSSITRAAAQDLGLAEGKDVYILIKSTDVQLGVDD